MGGDKPLTSVGNRIIAMGFNDAKPELPRLGEGNEPELDATRAVPLDQERERVSRYTSRVVRDRIFRRVVLQAYDKRCAITGLKLVNGGGRAEVDAAHIKPVESKGPDILTNGLALSGTAHWMFDRGVITIADDLEIVISRHANDTDSIRALLKKTGYAIVPQRSFERPHPHFLQWHRERCFKT